MPPIPPFRGSSPGTFGGTDGAQKRRSRTTEDVPFKDDFLVYHKHIFTKVGIDTVGGSAIWPPGMCQTL